MSAMTREDFALMVDLFVLFCFLFNLGALLGQILGIKWWGNIALAFGFPALTFLIIDVLLRIYLAANYQ